MCAVIPWILVLVGAAAEGSTRPPLQISVVETPIGHLAGNAEVAVYAPDGLCIRRGQTGTFGQPFNAEVEQPIDPALKELRVTARKTRGYATTQETVTLVYERNGWRVKSKSPEPPTRVQERLTALQSQRDQSLAFDQYSSTGLVEVELRVPPIPVCRSAPWQAFICGGAPPAPPGPPCGCVPPVPPSVAWLPSSIVPTSDCQGTSGSVNQRQAAITELGHAPNPEFHWARYGVRWVAGPHGMFWQARMWPENSNRTRSGDSR